MKPEPSTNSRKKPVDDKKPLSEDHPWRQLSDQDADFIIEQFQQLTDMKIDSIVTEAGYTQKADRDHIADALKKRRDTIIRDLKAIYLPLMINGDVTAEAIQAHMHLLEVSRSHLRKD